MEITHDITRLEIRKSIIDEIESDENLNRKEESFRRFEIYRDRQEKYILQRLLGDTSIESIRDMRTFTSINLTRKMIDQLASIYSREPIRNYTLLNDMQVDTMDSHYKYSNANVEFKQANRMFKLHEQCALKVLPKNGFIDMDVLQPHHYDVIPNQMNPEVGEVYIISSFDRTRIDNTNDFRDLPKNRHYENRQYVSDGHNEKIADSEDWKREHKIYFWWTDQFNFMTNRHGRVLDPTTRMPMDAVDFSDVSLMNASGKKPFVDVASNKDFEFWVRSSNAFTEFNIDFGVILSDVVNINKHQGFAIPVLISVEEPQFRKIGPDRVIWLKVDPNDENAQRPDFQFVTPNPDLNGALQMSEDLLKYFLVSKSINVNDMLQGTANATSGIDRLLMMIEKFEASQDDVDLFRGVEQSVYERLVSWHNVFREVNGGLNPKVDGPSIPEMSEVMVQYAGPDMIQSKNEHLDWIIKQLDNGLMSENEAIQEIREVDEESADKILEKIKTVDAMGIAEMRNINSQIAMESPIDEFSSEEEV